MKHTNTINLSRWLRGSFAVAGVVCTLGLSACSSIVDSSTPAKSVESDVSTYYLKLEDSGNKYYYSIKQPAVDKLTMIMHGGYESKTYNNAEAYDCMWVYQQSNKQQEWYFAVSPAVAFDLGSDTYWSDTSVWVDLQSPLSDTAHWNFNYYGDKIAARVTAYGVSAKIGNKTYNDVIQVRYTGAENAGVKWFARGIGEIFESTSHPYGSTELSLDSCYVK